jgi:hypothetical protein
LWLRPTLHEQTESAARLIENVKEQTTPPAGAEVEARKEFDHEKLRCYKGWWRSFWRALFGNACYAERG